MQVLHGATIAAWCCRDGNTRIWSLPSQEERATFQTGIFVKLALSPDAKRCALSGRAIRRGKSIALLSIPRNVPGKQSSVAIWSVDRRIAETTLRGREKCVHSMAFSPNGSVIATGENNGAVRIWQLPTGVPLPVDSKAHSGPVTGLAFSPDGRLLATGAIFDPEAKVWDTRSGELVTTLRWTDEDETTSGPVPIAFSSDGRLLAVGAEEGVLAFWSVPPSS